MGDERKQSEQTTAAAATRAERRRRATVHLAPRPEGKLQPRPRGCMREAKRARLDSPVSTRTTATQLSTTTTTADMAGPGTQSGPPSSLTALGQRLFGLACVDGTDHAVKPDRLDEPMRRLGGSSPTSGGAPAPSLLDKGERMSTSTSPRCSSELTAHGHPRRLDIDSGLDRLQACLARQARVRIILAHESASNYTSPNGDAEAHQGGDREEARRGTRTGEPC